MKNYKFIIHAGLHKTGTTSIQYFLLKNPKYLKQNNLTHINITNDFSQPVYSIFSKDSKAYSNNNRKFNNKTEKIENYNIQNQKKLLSYSTIKNDLILSEEHLCLLPEKALEELKKYIAKNFSQHDIKVIISVRDLIPLLTSLKQQDIKSGTNYYPKVSLQNFSFQDRIEKFFNVFGKNNVIIYDFNDAIASNKGLINYFFELLGYKQISQSYLNIKRKNKSLSYYAAEILSFIDKDSPLINNGKLNKKRNYNDLILFRLIDGQNFFLTKQQQEKIYLKSIDDLEWLYNNTGIKYEYKKNTKSNPRIKYNSHYIRQIKSIYIFLTPKIKNLFIKFLVFKIEQTEKEDKENLENLLEWTSNKSKYEWIPLKIYSIVTKIIYKIFNKN